MHNRKLMDYLRAGGGGHFYVMQDIDVRQELSNPYLLQTKISAKFLTFYRHGGKLFENIHLKTPENELLPVCLCVIENTSSRLCQLKKESYAFDPVACGILSFSRLCGWDFYPTTQKTRLRLLYRFEIWYK